MTIGRLKSLRFFVPPALFLVFIKILGQITGWWEAAIPDFSKSQYLPSVLIPGALYYVTPLRQWMNAPHHRRVNENIRRGLVKISGLTDRPDVYTWKRIRSLFYSLIDDDKSLTNKGNLALFNGLIWTSFADSAVLSAMFSMLCIFLYLLGLRQCLEGVIVFVLAFIVSVLGSIVTTRKQIAIGDEQLEIIELKYSSRIIDRLIFLNG